jgi:hypothetical protein
MWQTELVEFLRVLVNDTGSVSYTSDRLTKVLLVAGIQVLQELDFQYDYVVNVSASTITPDPCSASIRDDAFINLVCLKAACIVERGDAAIAAKQGIYVKDGSSAIDLRGSLQGKLKLIEKGWCAVYDEAKLQHQLNNSGAYSGVPGAAVLTPFRLEANPGGYYGRRKV